MRYIQCVLLFCDLKGHLAVFLVKTYGANFVIKYVRNTREGQEHQHFNELLKGKQIIVIG